MCIRDSLWSTWVDRWVCTPQIARMEKHFERERSACPRALGASHFLQKVLLQSTSKSSRHGRCAALLPPQLRPNPTSPAPYAAQLAYVAHLCQLAAPCGSSPPSLTRAPLADRLAPTPSYARPLRSSPEQSRATRLPCATSPTPGATIIRRPATKRAPPPVGDSESGQILWSLLTYSRLLIIDLYRRRYACTRVPYTY